VAEGLLTGGSSGSRPICTTATRTFGPNGAIGTPGQDNEPCSPYRIDRIPGGFVDISTTGTELLASGDPYTGIGTVQLPVPFSYYGQPFNEIFVTFAGFFCFGDVLSSVGSTAGYVAFNDTLPETTKPNGVVAPFWDHQVRNTDGQLLMRRDANRTIISWQDFRLYATTSSLNYQVHLYDSGVIEFHYGTFTLTSTTGNIQARARGSEASVWLEQPGGGSAVSVGVDTDNTIQQNSGIRFTP
jgi:hypothetical protein